MTPEQKIIAIAEFEGFIEDEPWLDGRRCWIRKDKPIHIGYEESDIPPYLTSRDAICGAVARLDDEQKNKFANYLYDIHLGLDADTKFHRRELVLTTKSVTNMILATPAQLADALLLTLGYEI